jgi:hypothetical protein
VKVLENEFAKNMAWGKEKVKQLASMLHLKESQVYKWNWDRRQAREKQLYDSLRSIDLPN